MKVSKLVIHHSASSRDTTSAEDIARWHKERGFSQIGYHKVILGNGTIKPGRSETIAGAHAKGANADSLGVCLTGNFENESPSSAQISSLIKVLVDWCREHRLKENSIYGHYNVPGGKTATACPGNKLKSQIATIKSDVKRQLPLYAVEHHIMDAGLQRLLRKALADDGRLSFDEVKEILLAVVADNMTSLQEIADLQAILMHSRSIDHRSRALITDFLSMTPTPAPAPVSGGALTSNFKLSEFGCRSGVPVPESLRANVQELANNLQVLRDQIGKPIRINSGYRTPDHNAKVGGVPNSQHLLAKAADIRVNAVTPAQIYTAIVGLIDSGQMKQGGVGLYRSFVHYDIRGQLTRWSKA